MISVIGPISEGMNETSLGRIDHDKGYISSNIAWQAVWENRAESSKSGRARIGKKHSDQTKKVIGDKNRGSSHNEDTRRLMSDSAKLGWIKRRNSNYNL